MLVEVHEQVAPEGAKGLLPKLERMGFSPLQEREGTYVFQNVALA